MNFLKKNYKLIIGIVIGAVLISGLSVYATGQYLASQVTYKDGKTVEKALNDLYSNMQSDTQGMQLELQDLGSSSDNNITIQPGFRYFEVIILGTSSSNDLDYYTQCTSTSNCTLLTDTSVESRSWSKYIKARRYIFKVTDSKLSSSITTNGVEVGMPIKIIGIK